MISWLVSDHKEFTLELAKNHLFSEPLGLLVASLSLSWKKAAFTNAGQKLSAYVVRCWFREVKRQLTLAFARLQSTLHPKGH